VKELDDWYSVKASTVLNKFGFIRTYYGSLKNALETLYPQHNWNSHRLRTPHRHWGDEQTQKEALEKFGREHLGVKQLDDWYRVTAEKIHRKFSFTSKYGSLFNTLKRFYPQHDWDPLKFSMVTRGSWTDLNTQRNALDRLGRKRFGVKELDDWYAVSSRDVYDLSFIKNYYNGSLFEALKTLYPKHDWNPIKFSRVKKGYWVREENVRYYHQLFNEWKRVHDIRTINGWFELKPEQVELFKRAAVGIFKSQKKMLEEWFPDIVYHSQYTTQLELQVCVM
jgi:hypothetical protein